MQLRDGLLGLAFASAFMVGALPAHADYIFYGPADVPQETWDGSYAGLNGGYAWAAGNDSNGSPVPYNGSGTAAGGYILGGQAGYNWQTPYHVLYGIEGDLQASGLEVSNTDGVGDAFKYDLDWFGTLRGRVGYAFSPVLFYFTGGLAFGEVHTRITPAAAQTGGPYNSDNTAVGYALGGGAEYRFSQAWSFKIEYLYMNLGKNDPENAAGAPYQPTNGVGFVVQDDDFNIIRFGLNYRFLCCEAPLK